MQPYDGSFNFYFLNGDLYHINLNNLKMDYNLAVLALMKPEQHFNNLGSYLAGLIEGDGSIYTPKDKLQDENHKLKPNSAFIEVVFHKKDLDLARYIMNLLDGGYLLDSSNYSRLIIKKKKSLLRLIHLINGEMRTPKIKALHRQILWCNKKWGLNIPLGSISLVPIHKNAWLSGFMDADGSFYFNWLYSKKGNPTSLQYYVRLSQKSTHLIRSGPYEGTYSNYVHMQSIADFLDIKLIEYKRNRTTYIENGYLIRTAKISSNYLMQSYFLKYPLFSYKYVCIPIFNKLYNFQVNKSYKKLENIQLFKELKLEMTSHSNSLHLNHLIQNLYFT